MKFISIVTVSLLLISGGIGSAHAQRYLTGELSGNYPAGEYIVTGNIHVLPRAKLSFEPGSVLHFENYTGIVVRGELICKGTQLKRIVFTSSRDMPSARTMPEAFDWIGIKVTSEAAGITLENCLVSYSSFGLNIESNATPVSLKEVSFSNNGSASLTREKKMMPVTDDQKISFLWPDMQPGATESTEFSQPAGNLETNTQSDRHSEAKKTSIIKAVAPPPKWKKPVRIGAAGTAVLGGTLWVVGAMKAGHYRKILDENANKLPTDRLPKDETESLQNSFSTWALIGNSGIALFGLGATGFAVTFFF